MEVENSLLHSVITRRQHIHKFSLFQLEWICALKAANPFYTLKSFIRVNDTVLINEIFARS